MYLGGLRLNKRIVRKITVLLLIGFVGLDFTGFSEVTSAKVKGSSNQLITHYEMINENIKLENAIHDSLKEVFKKKGFPDGRELTISHAQKEIIFVYRPYAKSDLNYLYDLKQRIEQVLKSKNYKGYDVKVLAYANDTNVTERLKREQKMMKEVAQKMEQIHQIQVHAGGGITSTDGRHETLNLSFYKKHKKIKDPQKINNYHKEFIKLAEEKGLNVKDFPTYFTDGIKRNWELKIIPAINQGLKDIEGLQITSTTVLTPNDPVFINTSINSSDPSAKEIGEHIEKLVKGLFQYDNVRKSFPGTQKIYVLSEDNKKINEG